LALIVVFSGVPDSDRIVRLSLLTLRFSIYVPGFTVIISPEVELSRAVCIELPGLTKISAAVPIPDINNKMRKANSKVVNFFILIPPNSKNYV